MDLIGPDFLHGDPLGQEEVETCLDVGHHGVLVFRFPLNVWNLLMSHGLYDLRQNKAVTELRLEVVYLVFSFSFLQVMVSPVCVDLDNVLFVGLHFGLLNTSRHVQLFLVTISIFRNIFLVPTLL